MKSFSGSEVSWTPEPDYAKLAEGLSIIKSTKDEDETTTPTSLDYNKINENLSIFKQSQSQEEEKEIFPPPSNIDYTKLSQNLSIFQSSIDTTSSPFSRFRPKIDNENSYQNSDFLTKSYGYTRSNIDVKPYAIAKYNFVAEFDNEMGFDSGEMVFLIRYVDSQWLEGEIDTRKGMFPISYVDIVVDCEQSSDKGQEIKMEVQNVVHKSTFNPDTYHKVLYNFHAQMDGDITVAEGEVVRVTETQSEDWVKVENSQGEVGVMPGNHLDNTDEFDGKALFDIERLMNYKSKKGQTERSLLPYVPPKRGPDLEDLKFFDPLRSPDGDMLKMEEELKKRASEPKVIRLSEDKVEVRNYHGNQTGKLPPKLPRDLETMISSNLSMLQTPRYDVKSVNIKNPTRQERYF